MNTNTNSGPAPEKVPSQVGLGIEGNERPLYMMEDLPAKVLSNQKVVGVRPTYIVMSNQNPRSIIRVKESKGRSRRKLAQARREMRSEYRHDMAAMPFTMEVEGSW
jgi:hypothetical protein